MTKEQIDIINEIRLKMFYDPKKTLSEQSTVGAPNRGMVTPSEKEEIDPMSQDFDNFVVKKVPSFKAYLTPSFGSDNVGSVSYIYLPEGSEDSIVKYTPFVDWSDYQNGENFSREFNLSVEELQNITKPGLVRKFTTSGGTYNGALKYNKNSGILYFSGYFNSSGQPYKTPNPRDFMSSFEIFMEDWGLFTQIVLSIVASAAIEYFSVGMGTPLASRILYQVLAELAINLPYSAYEIKQGEDPAISVSLAIFFSLLPFSELAPFLRGINGATKETAMSIAQKIANKEIKTSDELMEFYRTDLDEIEKQVFSRVMKQDPEIFKKALQDNTQEITKQILKDPTQLQKIAFKDQKWWKNVGVQLLGAFTVSMIAAGFGPESFSDVEKQRMMEFMKDIEKDLQDAQKIYNFRNALKEDSTLSKNLLNVAKSEDPTVLEELSEPISRGLKSIIPDADPIVQKKINEKLAKLKKFENQ